MMSDPAPVAPQIQEIPLNVFIDVKASEMMKAMCKASEVAEEMSAALKSKDEEIALLKADAEKYSEREKTLETLRAMVIELEFDNEGVRAENSALAALIEKE